MNYTKSLSKRSRMNAIYICSYKKYGMTRNTFPLDNETEIFQTERDPKQSTEYDYSFLIHRLGSIYQYFFPKNESFGNSLLSTYYF